MSNIVITYWEGDESLAKPAITRLVYAEWTRNGVKEHAYATQDDDPYGKEDDAADNVIPDDVRETLALLIAPSLRRPA